MADTDDDARVSLAFRVSPGLKARFEAYAKRRGLTLNAAGIVFLDEHLPPAADRPILKGP